MTRRLPRPTTRANAGHASIAITPPTTRKRKAVASQESTVRQPLKKTKTVARAATSPDVPLPATPQTQPSTSPSKMDSDDDFMSGASSQGFGGTLDSDDGSVAGEYHHSVRLRNRLD